MEDMDLLDYVIKNNIINIENIKEEIKTIENEKILIKHRYKIWEGSDGRWRTYLPDEVKGRKLVKRNSEEAIKSLIISHYKDLNNDKVNEKKKKTMTLKSLFPEWTSYKQARTDSTSYLKRITTDWNRFYQNDPIINKPISRFEVTELDIWAHEMIKKHELTKKSYYNMTIIIRQCLDYAVVKGYIAENIFAKVEVNKKLFSKSKKKPGETQVYMTDEKPKMIDEMIRRFRNNPRNTAPLAIILDFEIGVRIGEIVAIKTTDICGDVITIQRQEVREFEKVDDFQMKFKEFKIVEHPKTEESYRDIYLTETAKYLIDLIIQINEMNGEYCEDYLFVCEGKRISHYAIQERVLRGCKNIGIETKTMHKIRKTYISTLIDSGLNIDAIRRLAGHTDERTTYGNYCFNRRTDAQTREIIENTLNSDKIINMIRV